MFIYFYCCAVLSHSVMSDSATIAHQASVSMGDSPGRNTGVGCHALLQGIFLTQESNQGLLHCRQILSQLSYQGSPFTVLSSPNLACASYAGCLIQWMQ